jgi:hypothetical protein
MEQGVQLYGRRAWEHFARVRPRAATAGVRGNVGVSQVIDRGRVWHHWTAEGRGPFHV